MQGLILAAGMGKRLGRYTENQTKCMVKVNDRTLIEYALDALTSSDISRIVIVVGYEGKKLMDFLGNSYNGKPITYIINDIYDKTNNIYSLWLAKNCLLEDDTLLLESDLIFEAKILKDIIASPEPNLAVVAKFESWMDGTVTLLDNNDDIASFVPKCNFDWCNVENYYKTVNIYKFSKEFSINFYIPFLEAYIKTLGRNEYYEQVLRVIAYIDNIKLKAHKLSNEKWYEIDDVQDLDIASMLFSNGHAKLSLYQKRFGGYWRFPALKDFCYLVNPYFPDNQLLHELRSSFETLLREYPSGLNVQNLLAAKMFDCDSSEILTGNGAAELIKAAMKSISGKIGIIYPTFNEYAECCGDHRVEKFYASKNDFSYSIDELIDFSQKVDALVLINPDNPSGHFFTYEEILPLLDYLYTEKKYLIFDESFIDFAGEGSSYTLINSDIIKKYTNLIIIKSISKSYGVPGLRLGILATGNKDILKKVRENMPIWNINSFGEYFLQIIGKYKKSYAEACSNIAKERDRFFNELKNVPFIRVIPSRANYFLCEITSRFTAPELTELLLEKYNIFIKDCSGKTGFENKNCIRIAVRDFNDNNYLVEKLKEL